MLPQTETSVATRGPVLTKSMFSGYDLCINPYVGCEFGCSYCYVRHFVTDPQKQWGEFVRLRTHLLDKLPRELAKGRIKLPTRRDPVRDQQGQPVLLEGKLQTRQLYRELDLRQARLVLGTMTDPYQPAEKQYKLTRATLQALLQSPVQLAKVGIFTRSPLVLQDVDLIRQLPRARVHFTVTPFPPLRKIEPISSRTERRWQVLQQLREAGIRLHVNVSPVMPLISDGFAQEFCTRLAELQVAEFFVDPMQLYGPSYQAFQQALQGEPYWADVAEVMNDRERYAAWKLTHRQAWEQAWAQYGVGASPGTLPIWSDHVNKTWVDMRTGANMSKRAYGDDL